MESELWFWLSHFLCLLTYKEAKLFLAPSVAIDMGKVGLHASLDAWKISVFTAKYAKHLPQIFHIVCSTTALSILRGTRIAVASFNSADPLQPKAFKKLDDAIKYE